MFINRKKSVLRNLSILLLVGIISQISAPVVYASELKRKTDQFIHSHQTISRGFLKELYASLVHIDSKLKNTVLVSKKAAIPVPLKALPEVIIDKAIIVPESESTLEVQKTLGGPGQAEASGFSLNSTDGLVDKFTGDFNYSIPLMDVEGFPLVLSYNSNVTMNSEASWVGLGWDLNPGAVSREMRGMPDDFNGTDKIQKTESQLDEVLDGNKLGGYLALSYGFGTDNKGVMFTPALQLTYLSGKYTSNLLGLGNTRDFGLQVRFDLSTDDGKVGGSPSALGGLLGLDFGLGYSKDTKRGSGINQSYGAHFKFGRGDKLNAIGVNFGVNSHSREGITDWSMGYSLERTRNSSKIKDIGFSHASSAPYGTQTIIPSVSMGSSSSSFQFNFDAFAGITMGSFTAQAGFLDQKYNNKLNTNSNHETFYQAAIGYMHTGKRYNFGAESLPLMDYQRTNDGEYSQEMKHLPGSFQTFDLFYYNSPTQSGSFRANRTDYGTYYDPVIKSQHNSLQDSQLSEFYDKIPDLLADVLGSILSPDVVNLGIGVLIKNGMVKLQIGLGLGKQEVDTEYNSTWDHGVNLGYLAFTRESNGNNFDKSVYFKGLGENTPVEMGAWDYMGGNGVTSFLVSKVGPQIQVGSTINGSPKTSSILNTQNRKPITAISIKPIIAGNLSSVFIENHQGATSTLMLPRVDPSNGRKANHISSVEIVDENGVKNVYGVPAYNKSYAEVSFSSGGLTTYGATLAYNHSGPYADNGVTNTRGRSNYFNETIVPAYAHSFLLTEVVGPDYVDRTGDGLTLDDVGSYHKINYTLTTSNYRWRIPFSGVIGSTAKAFNNPGVLGSELDNIGTYSYGEKELWYTHSIEGRNLIAVFITSDRKDGHQADRNGFIEPSNSNLKKLQKLDAIILYNRYDYNKNPSAATPLQKVTFEYEYSLCKSFPGNQESYGGNAAESGKLTLTHIRVFGGASLENGLSDYECVYSGSNPDFSYQNVDGWGCYQNNDSQLPNDIYPYTHNKSTSSSAADALERGAAWKLATIKLPTGGELSVSYDSDHYSYVQEKRAMRHFTIEGMMTEFDLYPMLNGTWNGSTGLSDEFLLNSGGATYYRNVLIFKLDEQLGTGLTQAEATEQVRKKYFRDAYGNPLKELFIKAQVEIKPGVFELVPMFLPLDNDNNVMGAMPPAADGSRRYGYAVLRLFDISEMEVKDKRAKKWAKHGVLIHPIQRVALDYARQNLPDKIYGACASCDSDIDSNIDKRVLFGTLIYKYMIEEAHYASKLVPAKTLMRLYEPDNRKIGGNACVTNITYSDNWNALSGEYTSTYSWNYSYGGDPRNGESNGVAAFEPMQINDENVHYLWDTYVNIKEKFVDETRFHVLPIFRPIYPNPNIGYSEVVVTFNGSTEKGKSISKFHTYKETEFHTIEQYTNVGAEDGGHKSIYTNKRSIGKFLGAKGLDFYGFTEGFFLVTNDFHGKPIEYTTLDGDGEPQFSTKYTYYDPYEKIPMLDRKGNLANYSTALEYDIHTEQRAVEDFTRFHIGGLGIGISFMPTYLSFSPYYTWNNSDRAFYSYSLVKHMNYYARVKSVETVNLISHNTAENMLYDKYSGAVIASNLNDEFDDKLYQFSYPSHWYHAGLREIQNNTANGSYTGTMSGNTFTVSTSDDLEELFAPGDVVVIAPTASPVSTIPLVVMTTSKTTLTLINDLGAAASYSGSYIVTLVKTNRSNRLAETIQNVVTKKAISKVPTTLPETFAFPVLEIISASAITYRDKHNMRCVGFLSGEGKNNQVLYNSTINPFKYGVMGDLVLDSQLSWQSGRVNNSHDHGIRFDGTYSEYTPYYSFNTGTNKWNALSSLGKWRRLGESRLYNEYGIPQEGVDQLNIPSTVIHGYSNRLELMPIAQAVNAHKQDIGFDGFEDYGYYGTGAQPVVFAPENYHFSFMTALNANIVQSTEQKHSGLYSLKVNQGTSANLTRKAVSEADCLAQPNGMTAGGTFRADSCVCIPPFNPTGGKEYIVGGWIWKGTSTASINVSVSGGASIIMNTGKEIDGWVRVESLPFSLSAGETISISLTNMGSSPVYFDDVRVHPFLAGMTTVVYDPVTLLPLATHDGYNYTTFYNYDENLELVRVKVETEEGIKTVSELEQGGKLKFKD